MRETDRHGGRILADQLRIQGCEAVYCVPGESFLAALDGLHDVPGIRTVVCRQEGGAAMMAEAYGKLTGRPGVCMVTRGPGATNAASGVHVAFQDSTPMILIVGQVARATIDREAFQEMDYRRVFGQMAKWVAQVDDPARIPEYLSRAYHVAVSGRPGPVVLAFPEDVLSGTAATADAKPAMPAKAKAAPEDVERFRLALEAATRPMFIVGGGGWSAEAAQDLQRFSERNHIPVCTSFRCQDYFDNRHKNY
ncbi:MAG: thiamine pyrophosphate-binding protein, partial [Myxococcales bacterium]|nr:thiamine pyrophosphate-binding protein [Myxococcales bacterium]